MSVVLCQTITSYKMEIDICKITIENLIDLGILIVAIAAFVISVKEWFSHKTKEDNKLLSQLNKRYLDSQDIQTVVKYLRVTEPSNTLPNAYQIDLFLRFFEELGVYLENNSIEKDDVRNFFNFYLEQFYATDRGKFLQERCEYDEKDLPYLKTYKKIMGITI